MTDVVRGNNIPAGDSRAVAVVSIIRSGDVERLRQLLEENPGLAAARIVDARGTSRTLLHVVADWPGHFPNGANNSSRIGRGRSRRQRSGDPRGPASVLPRRRCIGPRAAMTSPYSMHFVDGGADIEAPGAVFTGGTPMSDAVVFAQWRAARRLLERGARTTIWQAAALGLLERVEACCEASPQSSDQITNSFWHACRGGQQETAEDLLDRGANLNWIGYDRKTPLQAAQESGVEDLVNWLRTRGARLAAELP